MSEFKCPNNPETEITGSSTTLTISVKGFGRKNEENTIMYRGYHELKLINKNSLFRTRM